MHGQGNYSIQVGKDQYARPPAFPQHPATTAPSMSNYGPFTPQSQVMQQGPPSFNPRPGAIAYQHAMTNVLHQGRPTPVASGGMSSAQSYVQHPRPPPQISNQNAHWSQNAHQLPPPPPFHGQSAYQFPSPQGNTLERGPSHQYPSHAPPPPLPPYSSTSNVLASDPCGSSVTPMTEQSYRGSMAPVLPPPPPPPLPPSPVRVPPLPPSSPSSDILEGNDSWKGLTDDTMELECLPPGKPTDERSVHVNIHFQHTESRNKVGSVDAEAAHSPADSDMDIEDDNTYPDEEKKNCLSVNSNNECGSMSHENNTRDRLQSLQHTEGHRLCEISVPGDLSFAEGSGAKAKGGGSEVASDCDFPITMKLISRDESGTGGHEQKEIPFDANLKEMSSENNFFSQYGVPVPVVHPLPELMEGADSFKILQGYSSNCTSENEDENIGDVSPPSINDETTKSDPEKGNEFGSVLSHKSPSESNKNLLPESMIDNVMRADQLAIPTGLVAEVSDRSHRDQKPISSDTYIARQSEDSLRKYDESVGLEEAKANKPDMKSDNLKVDEFGRLVREDVSDSDASDSPPHVRRHARRTRKRSRSQSRSRSPHDRRRRRRSPWRRKDRRGRSRSVSPRRKSRSRSPVLRRDTEFSFDKLKREKGCFDFLRGKCYRGASCRYSHHEAGKSERSSYNREKHHNRDALPTLLSPDIEGKVLTEKEMKDEGRENFQDMADLREANAERLPVYSTSQSPDKTGNLSGHTAHDTLLGKHNFSVPESASTFSDKIPQVVDPQGKGTDDSLLSEPSSLAQLLAGTPTHHPADRQDPTSQLCPVESHLTKPYSKEEVPFWTLNPSIANHPSQLSNPLPSASQPVSASFDPSILQNYNSNLPTSHYHLTPPNYSTYEAPVGYQHSHFPGPLKSLSSKVLPPPPPLPLPPPPPPPSVEHSTASQHMQQSAGPPWNGQYSHTSLRNQQTEIPNRSETGEYQAYSFAREPDHMLHRTDGYGSSSLHSSNLTSREGGPHMMGEGHISGDPMQGINSSKSFTQSQTNPLLSRSPFRGMHSSLGVGLSSDGNSSHGHPYIQQSSYGLQYSTGDDVHSKLAEPGMVSSTASRVPQDFLERNRSYAHGYIGSKISNHFNPYASTFDMPLSSKFSSNTLVRENDITTNTTYGTPVGLSSAPVDPHRILSVGSKNISSSSVLPAECISRPSGIQYDPLFDSIEQNSNSSSKAAHVKHEITGDSDDIMGFHGSGRLLNTGTIKQKGETAVSANDSSEKEECGETADMAVGAVLNSSPSNPNDAVDLDPGEFEIDQVKTSGKKKKSKEKSAKLFKISIAAFVKEVLKPSWRQGNMSKEAFKTIVKKTVDKVSGAMKGHQIPKSQEKVNHYIDSSRGKLTKLVMGYVDKYVKV